MGAYDNGTYDNNTYSPNRYEGERDDARTKLAKMLAERDARMRGDVRGAQTENNLTWGDNMTKGAMLGMPFGPHGAAIGAGVGALTGLYSAAQERHKHGQGWLEAGLNSVGDIFSDRGVGAAISSPSAMPLAAGLAQQYRQKQATFADPSNYSSQGTHNDQFGNQVEDFKFNDPDEELKYGGK